MSAAREATGTESDGREIWGDEMTTDVEALRRVRFFEELTDDDLGRVAPGWQPRVHYAGTYDATWIRRRSPLLPADFSLRFFNVAAPELTFSRFLVGGEPVAVIGASRMGPLQFTLPRCELQIEGCFADAWRSAPAQLETVALWPDDGLVSLTWRAKLPCDRKLLQVERVRVAIARMSEVA